MNFGKLWLWKWSLIEVSCWSHFLWSGIPDTIPESSWKQQNQELGGAFVQLHSHHGLPHQSAPSATRRGTQRGDAPRSSRECWGMMMPWLRASSYRIFLIVIVFHGIKHENTRIFSLDQWRVIIIYPQSECFNMWSEECMTLSLAYE